MTKGMVLAAIVTAGIFGAVLGPMIASNYDNTGSDPPSSGYTNDCVWSATDQDTAVIAQFSGPADCPTAFAIIADTGLNWEPIGENGDSGQLECSLSSGSESMQVYEIDYDSEPLVSSGSGLCSAAEQAGWIP